MAKKNLHSNLDIAEYGFSGWLINGEQVSEDTEEYLNSIYSGTEFEYWGYYYCPYCKTKLVKGLFQDLLEEDDKEWYQKLNRQFQISICDYCKFWEVQRSEYTNQCMDEPLNIWASSVAIKFESDLPKGCSQELAQYIRRNPQFLNKINPKDFEKFVADVFRANHKEAEVIHVGKPCDEGVDVIYVDDDSTEWLIQVKRREHSNRAEGFSTLQSILGTLALKGKRHGIIVTSADYFSYHAKKATKQAEKQGYTVELIDKGKLNRMISPLLPQTPWSSLFEHPLFKDVDDDIREYFYQQINFDRYNPNQPTLFDL
jgi:HJR/Mrr/RecB family endonuclease